MAEIQQQQPMPTPEWFMSSQREMKRQSARRENDARTARGVFRLPRSAFEFMTRNRAQSHEHRISLVRARASLGKVMPSFARAFGTHRSIEARGIDLGRIREGSVNLSVGGDIRMSGGGGIVRRVGSFFHKLKRSGSNGSNRIQIASAIATGTDRTNDYGAKITRNPSFGKTPQRNSSFDRINEAHKPSLVDVTYETLGRVDSNNSWVKASARLSVAHSEHANPGVIVSIGDDAEDNESQSSDEYSAPQVLFANSTNSSAGASATTDEDQSDLTLPSGRGGVSSRTGGLVATKITHASKRSKRSETKSSIATQRSASTSTTRNLKKNSTNKTKTESMRSLHTARTSDKSSIVIQSNITRSKETKTNKLSKKTSTLASSISLKSSSFMSLGMVGTLKSKVSLLASRSRLISKKNLKANSNESSMNAFQNAVRAWATVDACEMYEPYDSDDN